MKYLLTFCLLGMLSFGAAQTVYQIIPSDTAGLPIQEKLVYLAWQNQPLNRSAAHRVAVQEAVVQQNKMGWLEPVNITFNYGEPHINPNFDAAFFPRYIFGLSINVGQILKVPAQVREAQELVNVAQADYDALRLQVRAEVIERYQIYLSNLELLKLHIRIEEDTYNNFQDVSRKFQDGMVDLETYSIGAKSYNTALEQRVKTSSEVRISKARVEELIAMPLEMVR